MEAPSYVAECGGLTPLLLFVCDIQRVDIFAAYTLLIDSPSGVKLSHSKMRAHSTAI
jgi:hypothetical protein